MSERHPRVLIVGTIPYNKNTSSRAFDAYFHNWGKENMRQIFSNTKTPVKGHCGSLYQITDKRMLKRWLHLEKEVGVVFEDAELPEDWESTDLEVGGGVFNFLYRFGSKESVFKHLARKFLWRKRLWNTEKLRNWLDEFQPECVFLAFSDDFFIPEIALFVAERYNIPIMSCIGDDYYFNDQKRLSPFYKWYRRSYKKLIRRVFAHGGSAIYIGDKIRDKYNSEFNLNGETVYLTSEIERHPFRPIRTDKPLISYCGNIRLGRNTSLMDIGEALQSINSEYKLDVYSAEKNEEFIEPLRRCPGIRFHGAVPYKQVMQVMHDSDIVVIVEGFEPEQIDTVRYSLSTKAADAIASGGQILVYGDKDCGVIGYMDSVDCAAVCTDKCELRTCIAEFIGDTARQKMYYDQAMKVSHDHHDKERNLTLSERLFETMIEEFQAK